jgi:predicted Holliday junction resolvase-like endonuclease
MPPTSQLSNIDAKDPSVIIAILVEQMSHLAEKMEQMNVQVNARLDHMATKEQVAQLVARPEFERLAWRLEQVEKAVEENKPLNLWKNLTVVVGGVGGILALIVALTGWKPH